MNITKLIIAGGRDFDDYNLLVQETKKFIEEHAIDTRHLTIVSGMAPNGADQLGVRLAKEYNLPLDPHPADWDTYGKPAGHIRNAEMAQIATHLLAFWDGKSPGTASMIEKAEKRNLEIEVIRYIKEKI